MHYSRHVYALQRRAVRAANAEELKAKAAAKRDRKNAKRVQGAFNTEVGQRASREFLEGRAI